MALIDKPTTSLKKADVGGAEVKISDTAQNYLLTLHQLFEERIRMSPSNLATYIREATFGTKIGGTLPSVLSMVRRMARDGLLVLRPDKEIRFTAWGWQVTEQTVRRHRIAECLVVTMLGLELPMAHIEAHRLEHAISHELEGLIVEKLGYPTVDPFGCPIPGSGYEQPAKGLMPLSDALADSTYKIHRIPEANPELTRFMVDYEILPGKLIKVLETGQFRGVLVFVTTAGEAALGYDSVARIWVEGPI